MDNATVKCLICGDVADGIVYTRTVVGRRYALHGCDSCGAYRLVDPEPKGEEYYLKQYREDVPRTGEAEVIARSADAAVVSAIEGLLSVKFTRALDLCAEDRSVESWAVFGEDCKYETHGIIGRQDYKQLTDIPEGRFDVVSCFLSLEHLLDPGIFIRAAAKAAKPGGVLIVSVPFEDEGEIQVKPHHAWYFCRFSVVRLMPGTVLSLINYKGYRYAISIV